MEQNTSSEDIVIDEFASIIDGDSTTVNASAFQRYAVPPQFDGNSSEEENVPQVEEKEIESIEESVDGHDEEQPGAGYAPLVADEFGEFVSSEDFGDFYTPDRVGYLQETTATSSENNEKPVSNTLNDTAVVSTRVSIAPLDAGELLFFP